MAALRGSRTWGLRCDFAGCKARYWPQHAIDTQPSDLGWARTRVLQRLAEIAGWSVAGDNSDRCPQHREPEQIGLFSRKEAR